MINDVISVIHYSFIAPFKSIIVGATGGILSIKLLKEFEKKSFLEGDPIVLGYEVNEEVRIYGGNVFKIRQAECIIDIVIDKVETTPNKRMYERYPVSLNADIRMRDGRRKFLALVKDISYYGMLIYTKNELEIDQAMDMDLYLEKKVLLLSAVVMRKQQKQDYIEYGLGLKYNNDGAMEAMKGYIEVLKDEQVKALQKLKIERM